MADSIHTEPNDVLSLEILKKFRIIIRAAQKYSQWVEKQCGVSGAQLWLMQELSEKPGLRVGELAGKLAIHQTTTSNLLDGLEKREYINKLRNTDDQRVVTITLTEKGLSLLLSAPRPARGLLPEALRQLDPDILVQLGLGLNCLLEGLHVLDEEAGMQPLPFTM